MNNNPIPFKIICLINQATQSCIPLENFAKIQKDKLEKHVVSLHQSQQDLEFFLQDCYPGNNLIPHGLAHPDLNRFTNKPFIKYLKLIRKLKPDLVHAHHTHAVLAGMISRLFLPLHFVLTAHNDFKHFKLHQKLIWFVAFQMGDVVICNSANTRKHLPTSLSPKKIFIIYNGVDFNKINQSSSDYTDQNGFTIGTVGRMVPQKNLETLLRGFYNYLSNSESNEYYLVLIGDGPDKQKMIDLAEELGIQDRVIFKGEMNREDVYRELGNLDVFVVSSIYEGFCNAMVEAAGAALPVVATDIQPLPEVIGKDNARFFPVGDSQALGTILKELEADSNERERLGRAAQEHVISRYSLEASAAKHVELYKNFVQSRKQKVESK